MTTTTATKTTARKLITLVLFLVALATAGLSVALTIQGFGTRDAAELMAGMLGLLGALAMGVMLAVVRDGRRR